MWRPSSASERVPKSPVRRPSPSRSISPRSALTEALRNNPFRNTSKESLDTNTVEDEDDEVVTLNRDLALLAEVFPDVKGEVLRELLSRFNGDSRLHICTEELFRHKSEWVRSRFNNPPREHDEAIPIEEAFRTRQYIAAVRRTVALEFRALSKSAVDAVLAEVNFSYTNARPTLQGLTSKSWKVAFTNLFRKKKSPDTLPESLFEKGRPDIDRLRLLATGSDELDRELDGLYIQPLQRQSASHQVAGDLRLAQRLNQREAEEAGALFECQVCFNDITFEDLATCSTGEHVICQICIQRSLHEAVFGQAWSKSVDTQRGTLSCLAPSANDDCIGHIRQAILERAILAEKSGKETWLKFEERLADDALRRSMLPVVRCSFCAYAEADQVYDQETARKLQWRYKRPTTSSVFGFIVMMETLPLILCVVLLTYLLSPILSDRFYLALSNLALHGRTSRFTCRNPACKRASCLKCQKPWHDPHTCHEPLILSLRTTIEAARTAAIKRTCPRCGTSFVKSSGCNKLTCVCGYSMCYLCRKNIGKTGEREGGDGYRHFCEHFRPTAGQKCTECEKCDLYKAEDEDGMVKKAGEEAERFWREREGMVGVKGLEEASGNVAGQDGFWRHIWDGTWTVQSVVDWGVEKVVVVQV